jgi:outer membrane protein OmpA-like peptidoglycan-associated protein
MKPIRQEVCTMKRVLRVGLSLALITGSMAGTAAAAGEDCAPLGHLPTYVAGDQQTRAYASGDFTVGTPDDNKTVSVAGAKCTQNYMPKDGTDPLSDLEIQSNYRSQLSTLGAQIVFKDDQNTDARLVKNGQETWIKIYSQQTEIDVTVVRKQPLADTLTTPSGTDYALLGHMPGYVANDPPTKRNFDKKDFTVQQGDDTPTVSVEGATFETAYTLADGAATASDLAIQQNYRDALNRLGAQILFANSRNTTARLEHDGRTIWVKVYSQETEIDLTTVEEKAFAASIAPPTASTLKSALDKDGHVALYINFDFGKATIKPDAKPVLDQVVSVLQSNPALKLEVDGYTDDIGSRDANVKLSQDRAAAVVAALGKAGIATSRLSSGGFGPDKPIGDNTTAEGRARNRRVELVKR